MSQLIGFGLQLSRPAPLTSTWAEMCLTELQMDLQASPRSRKIGSEDSLQKAHLAYNKQTV